MQTRTLLLFIGHTNTEEQYYLAVVVEMPAVMLYLTVVVVEMLAVGPHLPPAVVEIPAVELNLPPAGVEIPAVGLYLALVAADKSVVEDLYGVAL